METEDVTVREQLFHDRVRETIICVLLFICLYILSHFILTHFKKNAEFVTGKFIVTPGPSAVVWLHAVQSFKAHLQLLSICWSAQPDMVMLLHFPKNALFGLWNLVFLFSNLSLVFLMPFAYFFTESEGFAGSKKGIMARVYETAVMLLLLSLLVLGIVWVASALIHHNTARESLYDLWEYYLPHLYSGISLFGVLLLLLCTPFGLSRMFSVTGSLLVKPRVGGQDPSLILIKAAFYLVNIVKTVKITSLFECFKIIYSCDCNFFFFRIL
uniref:Limb development membrane protein 1-like n=1 Tax=Sinocyclocheilus grahami TaxID=75366 RepID=A0A672L3F9_SINGR